MNNFLDLIRKLEGYEEGVWPPKAYEPILSEIGRIVFNWNCIERALTNLLNIFIGGEHRAIIATAHMGSNTQLDALRTLAQEFLDKDKCGHILHAIKVFERLRERRNFYVHSFNNVGGELIGERKALLGMWKARGRLKIEEINASFNDLRSESMLLHSAHHYFALIHNHFRYPDDPDYATLPEKFPLPDILEKPSRFVLDDQPPPQSSPA